MKLEFIQRSRKPNLQKNGLFELLSIPYFDPNTEAQV